MVQDAIMSSLATIVVALIGWLTREAVSFLNEKGYTEKLHKKKYLVDIAVNAIQQIYENEDGEYKLMKARREAVKLLNENKIKISETELQNLIEASVKSMKQEAAALGKVKKETEE